MPFTGTSTLRFCYCHHFAYNANFTLTVISNEYWVNTVENSYLKFCILECVSLYFQLFLSGWIWGLMASPSSRHRFNSFKFLLGKPVLNTANIHWSSKVVVQFSDIDKNSALSKVFAVTFTDIFDSVQNKEHRIPCNFFFVTLLSPSVLFSRCICGLSDISL